LKLPAVIPGYSNDNDEAMSRLCNCFAPHAGPALEWTPRHRGHRMTQAQQFEVFMQNYQNMVYSTALRLVASPAEAEDISQEVFLKAFERFAELRNSPTAGGWLKTVATNMSLNHLSRYRSRWSFFSELFSSHEGDAEMEFEFAGDANLADELATRERRQSLERCLHKLPTAQRVPLVLYHLDGMTYEEIAAKLGVSLGKVKTDIFRGREALRKRLAPQRQEFDC
jgi:RNA polymerase sigma-70 factor (ECF subfamily)